MYNYYSSSPTLTNVIIANSGGGNCYLDTDASISAASSNNLISDINTCGLTNGTNGNIIGSGFDPNLGALTGSPAYFPLNASSSAIDFRQRLDLSGH